MALHNQTLPNPSPHPPRTADDTKDRIQAIWQHSLPVLRSRMDRLSATAAAAKAGTLTDLDREEAISIAHKLAGSLGMFGFPYGTVLARQLEAVLAVPMLLPERLTQLTDELRTTLRLAA